MDLMMMALPVFALLIVAEATVTSLRGHNVYGLKDFAGSMSQLGINILVRLAIGGALIGLHFWLYQFRVFEVTAGPWGWLLTFVTIDFVFYGYHRAQHRVRFLWCAHVVHHFQRAHESRYCSAPVAHWAVYQSTLLLAVAVTRF
jgi:sterol desaturase/sphingolipid hydroxylase (fatty acid hydroxylase superfamily)